VLEGGGAAAPRPAPARDDVGRVHIVAPKPRSGVKYSRHFTIGRFRYIAWVKCPCRFAGKASALSAGKRPPGCIPIQSCGQSVGARRGKRYTEIGLLDAALDTSCASVAGAYTAKHRYTTGKQSGCYRAWRRMGTPVHYGQTVRVPPGLAAVGWVHRYTTGKQSGCFRPHREVVDGLGIHALGVGVVVVVVAALLLLLLGHRLAAARRTAARRRLCLLRRRAGSTQGRGFRV